MLTVLLYTGLHNSNPQVLESSRDIWKAGALLVEVTFCVYHASAFPSVHPQIYFRMITVVPIDQLFSNLI